MDPFFSIFLSYIQNTGFVFYVIQRFVEFVVIQNKPAYKEMDR